MIGATEQSLLQHYHCSGARHLAETPALGRARHVHTLFVVDTTAELMATRRPVSLQCSSKRGAKRHMRRHLADACSMASYPC